MKKMFLFLGLVLVLAAIWYLFIKSHDYQVSFESKTFPGTINQALKTWSISKDGIEVISQESLESFTQELHFEDSTHIYQWQINRVHDSLSKVVVYARDKDHSLKNKLEIPFSDTDFEKRTRKTLTEFAEFLNDHIKRFKVEVVGEETIRNTFCVCSKLETSQLGKAKGMMRDYPFLSGFVTNNSLTPSGPPFLEVTEWNRETDSLKYNFCFPVLQTDLLPEEHPELEFRNFYGRKALKAIYNGNYIASDRAWYALLDFAEKEGLEVVEKPVEIFYNNPNQGEYNSSSWKAEVFLPIKE